MAKRIKQLSTNLGELRLILPSSLTDLYDTIINYGVGYNYIPVPASLNATVMSALTDGKNQYGGVGIFWRTSNDAVDYYTFGIQGLRIYGGRLVSHEINRLYQYTYNTLIG